MGNFLNSYTLTLHTFTHLYKRARNLRIPIKHRRKQRLKSQNYNFAGGLIFKYKIPNSVDEYGPLQTKCLC